MILLLELNGFRAECASSGEQGLKRIKEVLPDLILFDFTLPDMRGADVGGVGHGPEGVETSRQGACSPTGRSDHHSQCSPTCYRSPVRRTPTLRRAMMGRPQLHSCDVPSSAAQTEISHSQLERRAPFEVDPLPIDILALLSSCGQVIRKADRHNVHRLLAARTSSVASGSTGRR